MVDLSPSMTISFPMAKTVLGERMAPMYYKDLAREVLHRIGFSPVLPVVLSKTAEDIREKMLIAGQRGTFYTGNPMCLAGLTSWFRQELMVTPDHHIVIPPSLVASRIGALDAMNRAPYMIQKTNTSQERLNKGRMDGKILEEQIANYFRHKWPKFYRDPDNAGEHQRWCDHDFRLDLPGYGNIKIDVAGPSLDGTYRSSEGKRQVAYHLMARFDGEFIRWESVVKGKNYNGDIVPESGQSPIRFAVFLNCLHEDLPYSEIREIASHYNVKE